MVHMVIAVNLMLILLIKKVTGKLISNQLSGTAVTAKERYKIEADIHGNRFRGSATASDKAEDSKVNTPLPVMPKIGWKVVLWTKRRGAGR